MDITTKDIIKILPFDNQFKIDLLEIFDNLSDDQKYNVERILWTTYSALYKLKYQEKVRLAMVEVKNGQRGLDNNLGDKIEEEVEKEMQEEAQKSIEGTDLTAARKAMEQIVKEIREAKKNKTLNSKS